MKSNNKIVQPKRFLVFIIKVLLFITLFLIFFAVLGRQNPQLLRMSRTAAITMTTFAVLGIAMTGVYGGFAVGKRKSREIIPSLCIAVFITDFVTGFQLEIMKMSEPNNSADLWVDILLVIIIFIWQCVAITGYVYFGNFVYFKRNKPNKTLVLCGNIKNKNEIVRRIEKYKRQYSITDVVEYGSIPTESLKEKIRHNDAVFIYEVAPDVKSMVIDYAYKHYTSVFIQTELSDIVVNYAKYTVLDDLSILASETKELSLEQRFMKRLMDIAISLVLIIITSPIMLAEAIAIKVYDKGKILFKQKRVTLHGKEFNVLKFRTMIEDADKKEGFHPAGENDDRITPVGKVLRKLRLDELPQLFNILLGDMSVVGPRPERIEHVKMYTEELPEFSYRLRAKAGLTGLAQIQGKYNTSPKDKLILDLMYIEKYSLWTDITLIFQTLKVFFKKDSTEEFSKQDVSAFIEYQRDENSTDENKK